MNKIKLKFTGITNKDIKCDLGKESEMVEILAVKLGKTNKGMLDIIIES